MKIFGIVVGTIAGLALVVSLFFFVWYMSVNNTDARLRADAAAEQQNCKIIYDEMWKVIKEQAQVPDAYKDDFKNVWKEIVNGSPSQTKLLVSAYVTRFNPQFTPQLYSKLMTTIEHERKVFTQAERKIIDIKRQHDVFRTKMPVNSSLGRMLFGTFPEIEIQLVTSDKTEDAFKIGKDDKLDIFERKK